jgi:hypothetical protein
MLLVTVFQVCHPPTTILQLATSPSSKPYPYQKMSPKATSPFAPSKAWSRVTSDNPKTILNRRSIAAKRGLDLSNQRDRGAFRTAKSRALKKLRTSDPWLQLSPPEREEAEKREIHELEMASHARKRAHEIEWFRKVELGEIASDEDDDFIEEEDYIEDKDHDDGEENFMDDGWVTEESDTDDKGKESALYDLREIQKRSGDAFQAKMEKLLVAAKKRDQELSDSLQS